MNRIKFAVFLPLISLLISGCASTQSSSKAQVFHEQASVNAVLQFASWDYTFLLQPRYDDNGFLLQVPRGGLAQVLDKVNLRQRDLAVVVVGWNQSPEQLKALVSEWKTILGGCGFQRVVMVKSNGSKKLNGSIIVDDSILSSSLAPKVSQL
jgi:hypothetical protein